MGTSAISSNAAASLFAAGYTGIIPISPGQKAPNLPGWTEHNTSAEDAARWDAAGCGVGLRTKIHPTIDNDVDHPAFARDLIVALEAQFGRRLLRRGRSNAAKFAIPLRTTTPFGKISIVIRDAAGAEKGKVEVLGAGQQFVVAGMHPSGVPYSWTDGTRAGGAELLAGTPPASLSELTPAIVEQSLVPLVNSLAGRYGWTASTTAHSGERSAVNQAALRAPSFNALREAVSCLRNDGRFDDRTSYIGVLAAIKAAAGPEREGEGLDLALDWAERWQGGPFLPETVRRDYETLRGPFELGWSYIDDCARVDGWANSAANEFLVVDGAIAPAEAPPAFVRTLATLEEEIAALHQSPDRAFLLASRRISGQADANAVFDALSDAASASHPLHDEFQVVMELAAPLKAAEAPVFTLRLGARVSRHLRLKHLTAEAQELLVSAAFALYADGAVLDGSASRAPKLATRSSGKRGALLGGLIVERTLFAIVGLPGAGKSALSRLVSGLIGRDDASKVVRFGGRDVAAASGSVLVCVSEDVHGATEKQDAQADAIGAAPHVHLIDGTPNLSKLSQTIAWMRQACSLALHSDNPALSLIVIDVFRDSFDGDENSSEVVGMAMASARALTKLFGAAVCLVHHAGRADGARSRGSTAFDAALDLSIAVEQEKDASTVFATVIKDRNGARGRSYLFHFDEAGVLRDGPAASAPVTAAEAVQPALVFAHTVITLENATRQPVRLTDIKGLLADAMPSRFGDAVKPGTRSKNITRAKVQACNEGWVSVDKSDRLGRGPTAIPSEIQVGSLEDLL
jgi:AAA domain/Bifunctional DNA primase/polymerase, N-terminal